MANPRIITNGLDKTSLSERVQKNKSNIFFRSSGSLFGVDFKNSSFFIQLVKDKLNHLNYGTSHCRFDF